MCECDYNTTGRIVSPDNAGIPSIRIYSDTNPPELLAITDSFGSFSLVGVCSDTTVTFEHTNEQIVMESTVSSLSPSYTLRNTSTLFRSFVLLNISNISYFCIVV